MKQECLASTTLADLLTPLHNAGIAAAVVERKVREWRDARRAKLAEAGARWFFFSALLLLGGDAGGRQLLGGDAGGRQSRRNRISGYRTATIGMSRTSRRPTSDAIQNGRLCCRNGPAEGRKCANFFRSSARAANATFRARRGRRPAVKQARRRWSRVCKAWARVPAGIANARARSVTAPIVNREPQKSTAEGSGGGMDPRTAIVPRCPPERCGLHRRNADPTPCSPRHPMRPCLARPGAAGPGGRLPQSPRAHHREHIGRRRGRHGDPHHRRGAPGEAWPALRHRGPRRRGRQYRGRGGLYRRPRRLYPARVPALADHQQHRALQEAQFRPGCAGIGGGPIEDSQPAAGASGLPGEDRGRIHCLCQSPSRRGHLRIPGSRHHLASERRAVLTAARRQDGACPLSRHGSGAYDLIGGQVDCMITELATAYKLHTGGKARILAVATERRLDDLPDIPTVIEAGVPGFLSDTWNAISAPPKTPAAIIAKLNRAVNATLDEPEVKERYRQLHLLPGGGSPADMAKLKKEETERWTRVIRDAGIEQQ